MVLWFVSAPLLAMRWFFGDPALDNRAVIAGALAPGVLALAAGGAAWPHSVWLPAVGLAGVMASTVGRRRARRRWLGLPIGVLWHQLFDGAWLWPALFWWPLAGWGAGAGRPLALRPVWLTVAMEAAGLAGCWWLWHTSGLAQGGAAAWAQFAKTGRLAQRSGPRGLRRRQNRRNSGTSGTSGKSADGGRPPG